MLPARVCNIALRTAHIASMGVLLGGHAFNVHALDVPRAEWGFELSLWLTVGTGLALGVVEAGGSLLWFHQGRGLMTLAKLGLLCAVPFLWDRWAARLAVLLAVVVLASVGSHMPARFRYYSVWYREVIPDSCGPDSRGLDSRGLDSRGLGTTRQNGSAEQDSA